MLRCGRRRQWGQTNTREPRWCPKLARSSVSALRETVSPPQTQVCGCRALSGRPPRSLRPPGRGGAPARETQANLSSAPISAFRATWLSCPRAETLWPSENQLSLVPEGQLEPWGVGLAPPGCQRLSTVPGRRWPKAPSAPGSPLCSILLIFSGPSKGEGGEGGGLGGQPLPFSFPTLLTVLLSPLCYHFSPEFRWSCKIDAFLSENGTSGSCMFFELVLLPYLEGESPILHSPAYHRRAPDGSWLS